MKKFLIPIILITFLTGCMNTSGSASLDVKDINKVDKSVLKKPKKKEELDDRPIKEVLMGSIDGALKDKRYEMEMTLGFDIKNEDGTPNGEAFVYAVNDSKIITNEIVDIDEQRAEVTMRTDITTPIPGLDVNQTFYIEDGKIYLGRGNLLEEKVMLKANIKPILIDVPTYGLEENSLRLDSAFKVTSDIVKTLPEKQMVRKSLSDAEKKKGYKNVIAVKIDENLKDEYEKDLLNYQDPFYSIKEVKQYILVFWLDEKDNLKKVLVQPTMVVDIYGKSYLMKMNVEYVYESKEKVSFKINPNKQGYYKLSELMK